MEYSWFLHSGSEGGLPGSGQPEQVLCPQSGGHHNQVPGCRPEREHKDWVQGVTRG